MQRYRGIFYARTYQAKTFAEKSEARGDTRLTRRNESETSGGVSLQKPSRLEKKEEKGGFETKEGTRGGFSQDEGLATGLGMCSTCPEVMISTTEQLRQQCDNWRSVEDNFLMKMDLEPPKVRETYTASECFKTVTCPEPHAIVRWVRRLSPSTDPVRWFDYSMCDIHNAVKDVPSFDVKCNGTHWTMHGYPLDAVTCAKKRRL